MSANPLLLTAMIAELDAINKQAGAMDVVRGAAKRIAGAVKPAQRGVQKALASSHPNAAPHPEGTVMKQKALGKSAPQPKAAPKDDAAFYAQHGYGIGRSQNYQPKLPANAELAATHIPQKPAQSAPTKASPAKVSPQAQQADQAARAMGQSQAPVQQAQPAMPQQAVPQNPTAIPNAQPAPQPNNQLAAQQPQALQHSPEQEKQLAHPAVVDQQAQMAASTPEEAKALAAEAKQRGVSIPTLLRVGAGALGVGAIGGLMANNFAQAMHDPGQYQYQQPYPMY